MERIERDTERDFFMSAEEARDYGVIDEIIAPSQISAPAEIAG